MKICCYRQTNIVRDSKYSYYHQVINTNYAYKLSNITHKYRAVAWQIHKTGQHMQLHVQLPRRLSYPTPCNYTYTCNYTCCFLTLQHMQLHPRYSNHVGVILIRMGEILVPREVLWKWHQRGLLPIASSTLTQKSLLSSAHNVIVGYLWTVLSSSPNFLYSVYLPQHFLLDFSSVIYLASLPFVRVWHRPPPPSMRNFGRNSQIT